MTIKVYKKRTHWYYKYHCKEYDLGKLEFLNFLEYILESKNIYFTVSEMTYSTYDLARIYKTWRDTRFYLDPLNLIPFIKKWSKDPDLDLYPLVIIPVSYELAIQYKTCIK